MEAMALSDCEDSASVGLDVPTDSLAVAIARPGRAPPEWPGTIPNHRSALRRRITRRSPEGLGLRVCYEAGPCGDGIDREITATGHPCRVVAPGLVPRGATDRVTTDRRAATLRAREHRSGSRTPARPDPDPNALRIGPGPGRTGRPSRQKPVSASVPSSSGRAASMRGGVAGVRPTRAGWRPRPSTVRSSRSSSRNMSMPLGRPRGGWRISRTRSTPPPRSGLWPPW